jgi:hypothetical protein
MDPAVLRPCRAMNAKTITDVRDRLTHRCHIVETGNDSHRVRASCEKVDQKQKQTLLLPTSYSRRQDGSDFGKNFAFSHMLCDFFTSCIRR